MLFQSVSWVCILHPGLLSAVESALPPLGEETEQVREADFESAKGSVEKSKQHPRASRCRDKHDPGDQGPQEQGELAGAASHPPLVWGAKRRCGFMSLHSLGC